MIVISSKEPAEVFHVFDELKIPYQKKDIPTGDFTNTEEKFIAERKGFSDFWTSMTDGRLYYQLQRMSLFEIKTYIFVENGSLMDWAYERKKDTNWIYSIFGEAENLGVNFREYIDLYDLARKLYWLDRKLGTEIKQRNRVMKLYGMTVPQEMLSRVPAVGEKKAKEILFHLNTLYAVMQDIFENDGERLKEIKGIGETIIKNIKNAMVLWHEDNTR